MITFHFHLQPQYKYELFHINFTMFIHVNIIKHPFFASDTHIKGDHSVFYSVATFVTLPFETFGASGTDILRSFLATWLVVFVFWFSSTIDLR